MDNQTTDKILDALKNIDSEGCGAPQPPQYPITPFTQEKGNKYTWCRSKMSDMMHQQLQRGNFGGPRVKHREALVKRRD